MPEPRLGRDLTGDVGGPFREVFLGFLLAASTRALSAHGALGTNRKQCSWFKAGTRSGLPHTPAQGFASGPMFAADPAARQRCGRAAAMNQASITQPRYLVIFDIVEDELGMRSTDISRGELLLMAIDENKVRCQPLSPARTPTVRQTPLRCSSVHR